MTVKSYSGGCQCGAVRYDVETDLDQTASCNCSRCGRLGTILSFTPASNFRLLRGEDALTKYLFNRHKITHLFCSTCGVQSFSRATGPDGTEMVAINARCLDGVDPDVLTPRKVDGRSF